MDREKHLEGAWDIHVHASPSLFPRWGDIHDLADKCIEFSMAGFVLKLHHGSSVEAAINLNRLKENIRVYGGVVLNYPVGGINPHAADTAISLGAKVIWLPTIHAANHEKAFGVLGGFHFQKSDLKLTPQNGISVIDENGELTGSVKTVLDLLNGKEIVLGTGHISDREIYALKKFIKSEHLKIPLLVNHALFKAPDLDINQIRELTDSSTWFETVYLTVADIAGSQSVKNVAKILGNTPDTRWIIASDSGQVGNLPSPLAISKYAGMLCDEGIEKSRVLKMFKDEPAELLHI